MTPVGATCVSSMKRVWRTYALWWRICIVEPWSSLGLLYVVDNWSMQMLRRKTCPSSCSSPYLWASLLRIDCLYLFQLLLELNFTQSTMCESEYLPIFYAKNKLKFVIRVIQLPVEPIRCSRSLRIFGCKPMSAFALRKAKANCWGEGVISTLLMLTSPLLQQLYGDTENTSCYIHATIADVTVSALAERTHRK